MSLMSINFISMMYLFDKYIPKDCHNILQYTETSFEILRNENKSISDQLYALLYHGKH